MTPLAGKRIGLNATCYNDRPSGARQRFLGLYRRVIAANPDTQFIVYDPADACVSAALGGAANVVARPTPVPSAGRLRKAAASFGFWRRTLQADRLDLFEHFNLPLVKAPACPTILTVHDIRAVHSDGAAVFRPLYRSLWRRALGGADHVVTVSNTMRDEILRFHPGTPVTMIYNGIDPTGFATDPGPARDVGYLLAVGHLEPRKNYPSLIAAMALLVAGGRDMRLVIVGRDGGSRAELEAVIQQHSLSDRVTIRSDVDDAELARLYANCGLLVFPSSYEGFGIPLIEAMAAGRPVVTSDIAVFSEITEGKGAYFPVDDPPAMAAVIARVMDDAAVAKALVDYGRDRVRAFAFDRLAPQVTTLYEKLLAGEAKR